MPQCQFPIFCGFCVLEKLHRKYFSELDETKAKVPIFPNMRQSPKQRWRGPESGCTMPWRGPLPGRQAMVWTPSPPPDIALPPIYSPQRENPKASINFLENILQAAAVVDARSGGSRSSSQHPAGEGNHHRRPSSSPCMPPE
jgi:hypothetical protein